MKIFNDGACIQPPVTFGLRFNRSVECEQTIAGSIIHNQAMELPVQIKYPSLLPTAPLPYLQQTFVQLSQLKTYLRPLRTRQRGNATACDTLQVSDDEIEFVCVLFCQGGDNHARLADVPVLDDVSLALQPVDGTANRGPAHIQPFGQVRLQNPRSRR